MILIILLVDWRGFKSMTLISIIIPVYNGELFIKDAIDSVINQTFEDFELIIINDGSNDKTKDILEKFKNKAIIKHQKNCGVSKTLNKGISLATGKYICFLAHDDMWKEEKLKIELDHILKNNYGVVYSDFFKVCGKKIIESHVRDYNSKILSKLCFINISSCMINKIYLNQLKDKDGYYFDESLKSAMDWDLWIRLSKLCDFKHIPTCLAYYRLHSEQTIRKKFHNNDMRKVYYKYNSKGFVDRTYLFIKEFAHLINVMIQNKKIEK